MFVILVALLIGCKSTDQRTEKPFEYNFERSKDKATSTTADKRAVTVRFDGVPFGQAMSILTQETSAPIVWAGEWRTGGDTGITRPRPA